MEQITLQPSGNVATGNTYVMLVSTEKPKTGPGFVYINHVYTNEFNFPSTSCSFGTQTVGYTR